MTFDKVVIVDWSGGNDRGPTPKADAIWACVSCDNPIYFRNRQLAEIWLVDTIERAVRSGSRMLVGFDFPFGYPAGFAPALCGSSDPLDLWGWFAEHIMDTPKSNNRFDIAGQINAGLPGIGPFWGNGLQRDIAHLPRKGRDSSAAPFAQMRAVEHIAKGAFTCWQMSGAGSVGGQIMMGLPVLHRLQQRFAPYLSVWPFQTADALVTLAEVWPSLVTGPTPTGMIKDAHQVASTARHFASLAPDQMAAAQSAPEIAAQEGWILGVPPAKVAP